MRRDASRSTQIDNGLCSIDDHCNVAGSSILGASAPTRSANCTRSGARCGRDSRCPSGDIGPPGRSGDHCHHQCWTLISLCTGRCLVEYPSTYAIISDLSGWPHPLCRGMYTIPEHHGVDITDLATLGDQFPPRLIRLGFQLMQVIDRQGEISIVKLFHLSTIHPLALSSLVVTQFGL